MCPACGFMHIIRKNDWKFNEDFNKPTFSPSIKVETIYAGNPVLCHSFIREGRIQFLNDCTHELAGQTVDLLDVEE